MVILVLRFEGIPVDNMLDKSTTMSLLCYGTTVGFSIIVSGDILRKLFSDKKEARDKIEILNNVLALILFTAMGVTRVANYNSTIYQNFAESMKINQDELDELKFHNKASDFSLGKKYLDSLNIRIYYNYVFVKEGATLLLASWQSPQR